MTNDNQYNEKNSRARGKQAPKEEPKSSDKGGSGQKKKLSGLQHD